MLDSSHWANRPHYGRPTKLLPLSAAQRAEIEAAIRPDKVEKRVLRRGEALLFMADGVAATDIAKVLGVDVRTVQRWKSRFDCDDPAKMLADAPRSGRPPSLSQRPTAPRSRPKPAGRPRTSAFR